jgi:hypothetical protein
LNRTGKPSHPAIPRTTIRVPIMERAFTPTLLSCELFALTVVKSYPHRGALVKPFYDRKILLTDHRPLDILGTHERGIASGV